MQFAREKLKCDIFFDRVIHLHAFLRLLVVEPLNVFNGTKFV